MADRRRGHGEGSIYQRKSDGKWVAAISDGVNTKGRPKKKIVYCESEAAAKKELLRLRYDQQQGKIDPEKMTVTQLLDLWLSDVVADNVKPATYLAYESDIRLYLKPKLGRTLLQKLVPLDVQRMLRELKGKLAPRSVVRVYGTLRAALRIAERWELVERNVATRVDPPNAPAREMPHLTPEQAKILIESLPHDDSYRWLYTVAMALGLRRGEVIGLRWADVDFKAKEVRLVQQIRRQTGKGLLAAPLKTRTSNRTIPLPEVAIRALHAQRALQGDDKMLCEREKWRGGELVFTNHYGSALEPGDIGKRFNRDVARADLPEDLTFHSLRHTCASFLHQQGVSPIVVMKILGHAKIDQTVDYTHIPGELKVAAAASMDKMLGS